MDTGSDSEEMKARSRREETILASSFHDLVYSPCHICQVFLETILNCLGYGLPRFQPTNPPTHDADSEVEMKSNEDAGVAGELSSGTGIAAARSRPTRPHISSGRGGQIN